MSHWPGRSTELSLNSEDTRGGRPYVSILVTALILLVTLIPGRAVPNVGFSGIDLIVHVTVFGLWGVAVGREFPRVALGALIGAGAALAVVTEVTQIMVPGRAFSWWDLLADALGATAGLILARAAWPPRD